MPRLRHILLPISLLSGFASSAHAQAAAAPDAAQLIERIMQADTNGDGQVTRAELIAYRAQQFARFDRNGDGYIDRNDVPAIMASRFEPRLNQMLAQFDANHDGRASREEFVNGPTPGFDMADANHDGLVVPTEIRVALAKVKAQRP